MTDKKDPNEAPVNKVIELPLHRKSHGRSDESIAKEINYEQPVSTVFCVQQWEHGVLAGVCFFNSQAKAKYIADLGNAKYAEMRVAFEMKIISYPVF